MKLRTLLITAFLALPLSLQAQATPDSAIARDIRENIWRVGVNTNPYEFLPVAETPVPKGYKAFYISHYGRHGSRSDWAGNDYAEVQEKFSKAHDAGLLTQEGEAALVRINEVIRLHDGMDGRLTYRGQREHRAIAGRLFDRYRKVFTKGSREIRAVSSVSQRCIISMTAFTGELLRRFPKLDIRWDTGEQIMKYCSSDDPEDVHRESRVLLEAFREAQVFDTEAFFRRMFTDPEAAGKLVGDPKDLMYQTYYIATISGSFDLDDSLLSAFTVGDLCQIEQYNSMNLYLRQCNSVEFGDRRMVLVEPLVDDVITKADDAIANGTPVADFRFGHDWQLLAFSSRIGIKGIGERMTAETCRDWPGYLYTPFAGNLQMVFYRNREGHVIVKFFINERETSLLTLEGGPYYAWDDVKNAFKNKKR